MIPEQYRPYEKIVTVACVNFSVLWGDKAANLKKMKSQIEEAAALGSNLIVFPELALSGYECGEETARDKKPCSMHRDLAEPIPGPATEEIIELCRKLDVYVVLSLPERDAADQNVHYISAVLIGPEGIVGVYRKLHLGSPPSMTENICFTPGDTVPVFETRYGPVGILICYDFWRHPELSRILTLKGARLVINPTASVSGPGKEQFMVTLTTARATENYVYAASANLVGKDRTKSFYGHSTIAGPIFPRSMPVLVEAGDTEQIISATLNFESLHRYDQTIQWKKERRADLINRELKLAAENCGGILLQKK